MSSSADGIGLFHDLVVLRLTVHGAFLKFGEDDVLLPKKFVADDLKPDDIVHVFIYTDSEDRIVATTQEPKGIIGDFVALEVIDILPFGAFVDWGLDKHLFVPNSEMETSIQVGETHVFKIVMDYRTNRLIGVNKIEAFLSSAIELEEGEAVRGIVFKQTDLGYKVLVDDRYAGLLYKNEVFSPIAVGDSLNCFVKLVRDDGKLDLMLRLPGKKTIDSDAELVLERLNQNDGILALSDKSDPDVIKNELGLSKKAFKRAIGTLYKNKLIIINPQQIELVKV